MEIPHILKLKKELSNKKKIKHEKNLNEILKNREKNRQNWDEEKVKKYDEFLINLKKAHDNYVIAFRNEIITKIKEVIKNNLYTQGIQLIEPQCIEAELFGLHPKLIYKGKFIKGKNTYSRLSHLEAGIKQTPFDQLKEEFKPYGYNFNDISDITLSKNIVIKIDFDVKEKIKLNIKPEDDTIKSFYEDHKMIYEGDSGLDLFVPDDIEIECGETKLIDLKIKCEMFNNNNDNISYYLYPRSSISKTPLILKNSTGIIDAGYRGNIKAAFYYVPTKDDLQKLINKEECKYTIKKGTRLVQLCAPNLEKFNFNLVNQLSSSDRGTGGFGSSGK